MAQFAVGDIVRHWKYGENGTEGRITKIGDQAVTILILRATSEAHSGQEFYYSGETMERYWTLAGKSENREGKQALEYITALNEVNALDA